MRDGFYHNFYINGLPLVYIHHVSGMIEFLMEPNESNSESPAQADEQVEVVVKLEVCVAN